MTFLFTAHMVSIDTPLAALHTATQLKPSELTLFTPSIANNSTLLPLFISKVAAGFPSPADDYIETSLDLNELLIKKPAATFFARAQGLSMINAGIYPNDILIIDRSLEPISGKIVICALNGELTVKRLLHEHGLWHLKAENPDYPEIVLHEELDCVIWGVVIHIIHSV
ncbi:MAG: LexA family protein [Methylovulum sp.]|jgi:DNA polymerase V